MDGFPERARRDRPGPQRGSSGPLRSNRHDGGLEVGRRRGKLGPAQQRHSGRGRPTVACRQPFQSRASVRGLRDLGRFARLPDDGRRPVVDRSRLDPEFPGSIPGKFRVLGQHARRAAGQPRSRGGGRSRHDPLDRRRGDVDPVREHARGRPRPSRPGLDALGRQRRRPLEQSGWRRDGRCPERRTGHAPVLRRGERPFQSQPGPGRRAGQRHLRARRGQWFQLGPADRRRRFRLRRPGASDEGDVHVDAGRRDLPPF